MFHPLRQSSICMSWIAMSIKIWSLIIESVKAMPTGIYRAKQSSAFKRMPCLPGSWHLIECAIFVFVITGQFCAGWCNYYISSSRSQNRIMTCYEWPRHHCGPAWPTQCAGECRICAGCKTSLRPSVTWSGLIGPCHVVFGLLAAWQRW